MEDGTAARARELDRFALDGRVAVVTGAASGLGEAIAIGLGQAGALVVAADLPQADFGRVLEALGTRAESQVLDVRDAPAVEALLWLLLVRYFILAGMAVSMNMFRLRIWRESQLGQARRAEDLPARRPVLVYGVGRVGSVVARPAPPPPARPPGTTIAWPLPSIMKSCGKSIFSHDASSTVAPCPPSTSPARKRQSKSNSWRSRAATVVARAPVAKK